MLIALLAQPAVGQTYLGGGYTWFISTKTSFYDVQGGAIALQREVTLGDSRWQVAPTLQVGFLYEGTEGDFFLNRTTTLSLSPSVAYELIRFKKFTFAPYVDPYATWFSSVQGYSLLSEGFYAVERTNRWIGGVEVGAALSIAFTEHFSIKLTPLNAQLGNSGFRQGMVLLLFRIN